MLSVPGWLSGTIAIAQQRSASPSIRAAEWQKRQDAFLALVGADREVYLAGGIPYMGTFVRQGLGARTTPDADRQKLALIQLLEIENATVAAKEADRRRQKLEELPVGERFTEAYVNYYGDVIAAVAALEDVRSVGALAGAIATGAMAVDALVSFGSIAVGPVAERLADDDPMVRSSAALTLGEMLARSDDDVSRSPAQRARIKKALLAAAADPDPFVRRRAVRGLARVGDAESIGAVRKLANEDPYIDTIPGREGRFPVREAAAQALEEMR
jgi:HEAT repeat protein